METTEPMTDSGRENLKYPAAAVVSLPPLRQQNFSRKRRIEVSFILSVNIYIFIYTHTYINEKTEILRTYYIGRNGICGKRHQKGASWQMKNKLALPRWSVERINYIVSLKSLLRSCVIPHSQQSEYTSSSSSTLNFFVKLRWKTIVIGKTDTRTVKLCF